MRILQSIRYSMIAINSLCLSISFIFRLKESCAQKSKHKKKCIICSIRMENTDAIRRGDGEAAAGHLRDGIEAYKKATE